MPTFFPTERAETVKNEPVNSNLLKWPLSETIVKNQGDLSIGFEGWVHLSFSHIDPFLPQLREMIIRHHDDVWSTGILMEVLWNFMSQICLAVCQAWGLSWVVWAKLDQTNIGVPWPKDAAYAKNENDGKNECTDSVVLTKQSSAKAHSWQYNAWQWHVCYFCCKYFVHVCSRILVFFLGIAVGLLTNFEFSVPPGAPDRILPGVATCLDFIGHLMGVATEPQFPKQSHDVLGSRA